MFCFRVSRSIRRFFSFSLGSVLTFHIRMDYWEMSASSQITRSHSRLMEGTMPWRTASSLRRRRDHA